MDDDETRPFLEAMIALGIEQRAQTDATYLALKRDAPGRVDAYRKERHQLEANILAKWQVAFDAVDLAYLTALEITEVIRSSGTGGAAPTRPGRCRSGEVTRARPLADSFSNENWFVR